MMRCKHTKQTNTPDEPCKSVCPKGSGEKPAKFHGLWNWVKN